MKGIYNHVNIRNGSDSKAFFRVVFFIFLLFSLNSCSPWRNAARRNMTVVFYNVENFFDTKDQPGKQDEAFTPSGENRWTFRRYQKKLNDISRAVGSINEGDLPEIVGLCEVENEQVVRDLIRTGLLAAGKYKVIYHESPDARGIDCALIYRPSEFKVSEFSGIPVHFEGIPEFKTRDILYVRGSTRNREEFHLFVNHWPSRRGGTEKTAHLRIQAAKVLKGKIDAIRRANPGAKIIAMGDMNDEPDSESLSGVLNARPPEKGRNGLVNLMFPEDKKGKGSYKYQDEWYMLDNIIVSSELLDERGFRCFETKGFVFHQDWMEYSNSKGEILPARTYLGSDYLGGVSDHFPVYIRLRR